MTLDYYEDYIFLSVVRKLLGNNASRKNIYNLLKKMPEISKINFFRNSEWRINQEKNEKKINPYIKIKGRKIGPDYLPVVIVELGINHKGSLKLAKKMVDAAIRAGAEIIKHQTHVPEDEMSLEAKSIIPKNANRNIYDLIKSCMLSKKERKN